MKMVMDLSRIRTLTRGEKMAHTKQTARPGMGSLGSGGRLGGGSSRRSSGSGCCSCWSSDGSSPATEWTGGPLRRAGDASAGWRGSRRGPSACWRRGRGNSWRGPCRGVRGFRTCLEDRCGRRSRSSGLAGGRPRRRRRAGWPVLRTQRRRGVGWGPRGLCPRTTAVPACSRRFRYSAGMPGGRWREGCLPGWRRRWWRERRPWCLQRSEVGWAWPSVQVVGGSYRTSICGRDLLPCRGRSSMKAGCSPDVGKCSRY